MIKEIIMKTNVTRINEHKQIKCNSKEGIICVVYENGCTHILDLSTMHDMYGCDFIIYEDNSRTKTKVLFRNIELDDFFFKNVATGKTSVKDYYKKFNQRIND